jgi:hypothetical protein
MLAITDEARDYLLKKGGTVHLSSTRHANLCRGRINFGPSVRLGVPKNVRDYNMCIINQIKVYRLNGFESPFPLTISVHNLFGLMMLNLTGWKLV